MARRQCHPACLACRCTAIRTVDARNGSGGRNEFMIGPTDAMFEPCAFITRPVALVSRVWFNLSRLPNVFPPNRDHSVGARQRPRVQFSLTPRFKYYRGPQPPFVVSSALISEVLNRGPVLGALANRLQERGPAPPQTPYLVAPHRGRISNFVTIQLKEAEKVLDRILPHFC